MSSTGVHTNLKLVGGQSPSRSDSPASNISISRIHHKRRSPEASVSLRHGKFSSSAAEPNKAFAVPPKLMHGNPHSSLASSHYRRPMVQFQQSMDTTNGTSQQSSDHGFDKESGFNSNTSGSNDRSVAEDWFKNWNTNVGEFNEPYAADGDSPYYLPSEKQRRRQKQRAESSNTNAGAIPSGTPRFGAPSLNPSRTAQVSNPSFPQMVSTQESEDESDVYRSVIDDLTIKNKKLKKKLRKMERLHCNEMGDEKLFEVRCYGLPPARKQELQELLQKFAGGADGGGVYEAKRSDAVSNANATSSTNPSSSSLLQNTDSAYATDTRLTSSDGVTTGEVSREKSSTNLPLDKSRATQPTIPDTRPVQFASERAKMKLVVKRLEQLFTGSDALQSELEKSKAQQQVAVEASHEKHDSANENMADSGDEGDCREAAIMASGQQDDDSKTHNLSRHGSHNSSHNQQQQQSQHGRTRSNDTSHQRPTRPMDIDPNRAQVAADNVEYLEHMSLSLFRKPQNFKPAAVGESTGWVYLNLINNLAQIHTMNVSLSFIKKAISLLSDKLELSSDGNKVRWRGGLTGTRLSSDNDTSSTGMETSSGGESSPSDGSKSRDNVTSPEAKATMAKPMSTKARSSHMSSPKRHTKVSRDDDKFRYRPLLFHRSSAQKSSSEDSSDRDSSASDSEAGSQNSGGPAPMLENNTNIEISDISKFAPLDGPIIYFGGAPFCTDLSAQIVFREGGHPPPKDGEAKLYNRVIDRPIGPPTPTRHFEEEKTVPQPKPLSNFDWSLQDVEMDTVEDSEERLPQLTSIMSTASDILPSVMPPPTNFVASGIGGVRPDDNFVVYVKTMQKPSTTSRRYRVSKSRKIHHSIPMQSLNAFMGDEDNLPEVGYETETLDALQIRLQQSKLPDPIFAISLSEGSTDPFATNSDEPHSYESHLSFAYNIEEDSRSSGEGIPSFHSPELGDESPMDLDAEEGINVDNPLAPLSVVATAGDLSQDGSDAPSPKDMSISKNLDDMDIGAIYAQH